MNQFRDPLFYHRMDIPNCPPPKIVKLDDPQSRETSKVVELKDSRGVTKFKLMLTDYDNDSYGENDDLQSWDVTYQVTVLSYCYKEEDQPIVLFEKEYEIYEQAIADFERLKEQYRAFIAVENRRSQDISIFTEKINYHIVDPDCCKNCIWSQIIPREQQLFNDWKKHKNHRVCMNPAVNMKQCDYEPHIPMRQKDPCHPYADKSFHDNYRTYSRDLHHLNLSLAPYTDDNGICDNYKRDTMKENCGHDRR